MARSRKVTVVPSTRTPRAGAITLANLVIAGFALGITVVAGKRMFGSGDTSNMPNLSGVSRVVAGTDTAPQQAPTAEQALGAFRVRNLAGKSEPLITKGQPVILMVSSRTCTWCKRALKDLGELSAGRPLPRLKVITLEGAAEGVAMLAKEGITGAQLVGPVGGADQRDVDAKEPSVAATLHILASTTARARERTGQPEFPEMEIERDDARDEARQRDAHTLRHSVSDAEKRESLPSTPRRI